MIHVQKQKWTDFTRCIVVDTDGGSVQIELYSTKQDWGGTAFIYGLWVEPECRRKGIAGRLLDIAEAIVREAGHKSVTLEWKLQDTPKEILAWYERRKYKGECTRMVKDL